MTTATNTPAGIEQDIPCERCGYNLRGLTREGQCPECGLSIRQSTETWNVRHAEADIWASDPRWIRNVSEGLVLALIVFVLMILLAVVLHTDWGWIVAWKSPQRRWVLGVAATAFVLSWSAAWKLSIPEKREITRKPFARPALRVCATVYLASEFVLYFMPRDDIGLLWTVLVFTFMTAAMIATIAWFLCVAELAQRCGGRVWAMQASLLALFAVIVFVISLLPELDAPVDSLSGMYRTHLIQFGPTQTLEDFIEGGVRGYWHPLEIAGALLPAWSMILTLRLLLMLRRAARAGSPV